ncbi:MAG TPA: cell division topological specificity factor MinE [Candidatus Binatia bacterium]|jgi:cell division topological specificity factor|nr:cell division topological specificity factor MinE [Candidatus Binatia bacterium]
MNWLDRLLGREEPSSSVAKTRLQMVLTHDRSDISPGLIEMIKDDIIEVIARHLAVDPDQVVVHLTRNAKESRLVAEIPLRDNGRRKT